MAKTVSSQNASRLVDKLLPDTINWNDKMFQTPKIEAMRVMRERERIATFTRLVQTFGVSDTYTFPTESLHEQGALNLAQVCVCIRALGIEVRHVGIEGRHRTTGRSLIDEVKRTH